MSDEPLLENVLLLASLTECTGNAVTAQRIGSLLPARQVIKLDLHSVSSQEMLSTKLCESNASLVLGIHAFRAGRFLLDCGVPYVIVLGGTDMNENMKDEDMSAIIRRVVAQADAIVAFNDELLSTLLNVVPAVQPKVFLIPQSVTVCAEEDLLPAADVRRQLAVQPSDIFLLLPAGLRPVKDVLYAVDAICAWHESDSRVVLRIVGPSLDAKYAQAVEDALSGKVHVAYSGMMPQKELHSAMRAADVVLNTSKSEGMCNSLLEAMLLGTPVLARSNTGNMDLITDGETGLLFDSPEELVTKARTLLCEDGGVLASKLSAAARAKVEAKHSVSAEAASYAGVVQYALEQSRVTCQ